VLFYSQKIIANDKSINKNAGFKTDGDYFYLHLKGHGLFKIGLGETGDQMLGKVYQHKSYRVHEKVKLVYINGMLLCRTQEETKKAIFLLDPHTLEETKEQPTHQKG
jgi:hypothetical protein